MNLQIGIFVAVGLLLLMLVIFLLGSEKRLFENHYKLVCHFTDVGGIREGATVQLAGIHVGTVSRIYFDEDIEKKKIRLVLNISTRFQNRIREDSEVSIVTQGLLGDRMVMISVGSPIMKELQDGEEIASKEQTGISAVLAKSDDLLLTIIEATDSINVLLEEIKEGEGIIHQLIYDDRGKKIIGEMHDMTHHLARASAHMEKVTQKINQGQGTAGALINDASLYNDAKTLLGKANRNKLVRSIIRYTLKTREENLTGHD